MNTRREDDHGEYWEDTEGLVLRFDMKKLWKWIVSFFLLVSVAQAQVAIPAEYANGVPTIAKVTLSNLALYSEQLDNAAWTKDLARHVITANSVIAPDGALTGDLATLSGATTATRVIYPTAAITVVNGSTYRQSAYLKAGTHRYVEYYSQTPATAYIDVDLATCTTLRVGSTTLSSFSRGVGNGWCYVSFTYVSSGVAAYPSFLPLKDAVSNAATSWTSTGAETYSIWGISFQLASDPTNYLPTTTPAVTLVGVCPEGYAQDPYNPKGCSGVTSWANKNKTPEQIAVSTDYYGQGIPTTPEVTLSNILIKSEQGDYTGGYTATNVTVTANTTAAPDTTITAETLTASAGTSVKRLSGTPGTNRPLSAGPGTLYRAAIYVKMGTHRYVYFGDNGDDVPRGVTVDLQSCLVTLESGNAFSRTSPSGNGWCRIETIGTRTDVCGGCKNLALDLYLVSSATSVSGSSLTAVGTETVYVWGMQENLASSPPDYLQTDAVAATLGPLCPMGSTQALFNPNACVPVFNKRFENRTPEQIVSGGW